MSFAQQPAKEVTLARFVSVYRNRGHQLPIALAHGIILDLLYRTEFSAKRVDSNVPTGFLPSVSDLDPERILIRTDGSVYAEPSVSFETLCTLTTWLLLDPIEISPRIFLVRNYMAAEGAYYDFQTRFSGLAQILRQSFGAPSPEFEIGLAASLIFELEEESTLPVPELLDDDQIATLPPEPSGHRLWSPSQVVPVPVALGDNPLAESPTQFVGLPEPTKSDAPVQLLDREMLSSDGEYVLGPPLEESEREFSETLPTAFDNPSTPSESNETVFEINPENLSNPTQLALSDEDDSKEILEPILPADEPAIDSDIEDIKKDTSRYRSIAEFEADFGLDLESEPAVSADPYTQPSNNTEIDDKKVLSSTEEEKEKPSTYYPTDRVMRDFSLRSRIKGAVQGQRLEDVTDRGPEREREGRKIVRHQALRGETTVSLATAPAARRSARPSNPRRDALVNSTKDRNWVTWFIVGLSLTFAFYLLFF